MPDNSNVGLDDVRHQHPLDGTYHRQDHVGILSYFWPDRWLISVKPYIKPLAIWKRSRARSRTLLCFSCSHRRIRPGHLVWPATLWHRKCSAARTNYCGPPISFSAFRNQQICFTDPRRCGFRDGLHSPHLFRECLCHLRTYAVLTLYSRGYHSAS